MNILLKIALGFLVMHYLGVIFNLIKQTIAIIQTKIIITADEARSNRLKVLGTVLYETLDYFWMLYHQTGTISTEYAYLSDCILHDLIVELGGDLPELKERISNKTSSKSMNLKEARRDFKRKPPSLSDIESAKKKSTKQKKELTDNEINKILDEWEKKHPNWKDKKDTK